MAGASQEIYMPERSHLTGCLVPADSVFVTENVVLQEEEELKGKNSVT